LANAKVLAAACSTVFESKMGSSYSLDTFDSEMQNANYIQEPNTFTGRSKEASTVTTGPISGRNTTLRPDFYLDTAERQPAVLVHENIHRSTGWTDAKVFEEFGNSGMTTDEVNTYLQFQNTDGITTWILRGCTKWGIRMQMIGGIAGLCLALIGGVIGASSVTFMHDHMRAGKTLRVRELKIIDAHNNVRAVLATDQSNGACIYGCNPKRTLRQFYCKLQKTMAHSVFIPLIRITLWRLAISPLAILKRTRLEHGELQ
jgi:hypothetical protein